MKDQITLVGAKKSYAKRFDKLRNKLFDDLENILISYEAEIEYIKDPKNKMAKANLGFQRSIAIDHIIIKFLDNL